MKKYITISIVSILMAMSSCTKESSNDIPRNELNGDYLYTSNSTYYSSNNIIEYEGISNGSLYINSSSSNSFEIYPNIGYYFNIGISDLNVYGDTTIFKILTQEVSLKSESFTLRGANKVSAGSIGYVDGYYTNDKIVFSYISYNIKNYEWVETRTEAIKRY